MGACALPKCWFWVPVVRSLWAGLMTWRRWRCYIKITEGLTLTDNFISYAHYLTVELLVHAGINHQLALFHAFPHLDVSTDYGMRNTGNRGIEAIHGIFRGGSASLPITAPNLTFQEFLSKMNKTNQIYRAEQTLKRIEGNTIVASKHKRRTHGNHSGEAPSPSIKNYVKPKSYDNFVKELTEACLLGDKDSKDAITSLAPEMTKALKKAKPEQWENPNIAIEERPSDLSIIADKSASRSAATPSLHEELIDSILGPCSATQTPPTIEEHTGINEALANIIMDMDHATDEASLPRKVSTLLKAVQPYRERPSKDRSKRFMVGDLPFDAASDNEHNLYINHYWTIYPTDLVVRSAKVFLFGYILYIAETGKPKTSSITSNPNTEVILSLYKYDSEAKLYHSSGGRSSLLPASTTLIVNVTDHITTTPDGISFNHSSINDLADFEPFHSELDVDARITPPSTLLSSVLPSSDTEDPYIVERIEKKRYNSRKVQYEYFIKWVGYSSKENTWELPSVIPSIILDKFERSLLDAHSDEPRRPGLRERSKLKTPNKPDFILNT